MKKLFPILACMLALACEDAHIPLTNALLDNWEVIDIAGSSLEYKNESLTHFGFKPGGAYANTFINFCSFQYSLRPDGTKKGTISMGLPSCDKICCLSPIINLLASAKSYEISEDTLRLVGDATITLLRRPIVVCNTGCLRADLSTDGNIFVHVQNPDQSPAQLDEIRLIRLSDHQTITRSEVSSINFAHPYAGAFMLVDHRYKEIFTNHPVDIVWQGYLGGKLVVEKTFRVTSNCCYLTLLSGDLSITL
ncbi:MAG TPA: hypothetical protein PLX35_16190 [Cyclobacteriaceae bacterium]|nr:hypothetical protein [Cyclobacteriaceae bacterium]